MNTEQRAMKKYIESVVFYIFVLNSSFVMCEERVSIYYMYMKIILH